ncbi:hypothetical protein TSTA_095840 [Talaromyces stipitatus ATCC 10500]|uniref:Uncharacterized protein n=1 Tax=Talaromyces stipitatus (strain ATCC 10500 / CBS 375.48 / QM 6759 / NRRL 1006) TaxID=441959 RepID=B8M3G3_TALSN|nr:uncharacterized protein TSTA_095840 [Talaromyces stipitatus ATCC 10500]EED22335.1 hypothetical protein TSTA_095840 [Talaromyces stipitatus ATCC 10500]
MVFWYRIPATEKLGSSDGADNGSSPRSGSMRYSRDAAPTVDRFSVRPTAIQVGILNLDADEQANLRRVLLLRDLYRTVDAIDDILNMDHELHTEQRTVDADWHFTSQRGGTRPDSARQPNEIDATCLQDTCEAI